MQLYHILAQIRIDLKSRLIVVNEISTQQDNIFLSIEEIIRLEKELTSFFFNGRNNAFIYL